MAAGMGADRVVMTPIVSPDVHTGIVMTTVGTTVETANATVGKTAETVITTVGRTAETAITTVVLTAMDLGEAVAIGAKPPAPDRFYDVVASSSLKEWISHS
jgi:hypothetical protein